MSSLREDHREAIVNEYIEGYNCGYLIGYAQTDHMEGWSIYKILEEIQNIDQPVLEYIFNEI